jgi:hypothetical protein
MNETDAAIQPEIPGYEFGTRKSAVSPVSEEDLRLLEQTVGWSESDSSVLQKHADLIRHQAEHMVDSWRSVIGEQPHLAKWFFGPDGKADDEYKARVKRRFVQWVTSVALRKHFGRALMPRMISGSPELSLCLACAGSKSFYRPGGRQTAQGAPEPL